MIPSNDKRGRGSCVIVLSAGQKAVSVKERAEAEVWDIGQHVLCHHMGDEQV